MTAVALLIDLGSTFTKLRAVDLPSGEIIGASQGPSTVATDVTEGLTQALSELDAGWAHRPTSSTPWRVPVPPGA